MLDVCNEHQAQQCQECSADKFSCVETVQFSSVHLLTNLLTISVFVLSAIFLHQLYVRFLQYIVYNGHYCYTSLQPLYLSLFTVYVFLQINIKLLHLLIYLITEVPVASFLRGFSLKYFV